MDKVPQRNQLAQIYRKPLRQLEKAMPLYIKNPNVYQLLGLLFSVSFLFVETNNQQIILISLILFLDWLDGATARKYSLISKKGYLIDVVVDRLSEGLIFASLLGSLTGRVFFAFYLLNNIFVFYSLKSSRHTIIALRFFYLVFLIIESFL